MRLLLVILVAAVLVAFVAAAVARGHISATDTPAGWKWGDDRSSSS